MKPLKAAATTSQPVLTVAQIETIFFKVPELYEIHREFYDGLLPRVQQWSHHQRVGDLFQKLVSKKKDKSKTSVPMMADVTLLLMEGTTLGTQESVFEDTCGHDTNVLLWHYSQ